jgi:hypothetical protein
MLQSIQLWKLDRFSTDLVRASAEARLSSGVKKKIVALCCSPRFFVEGVCVRRESFVYLVVPFSPIFAKYTLSQ